VQGAELGLAWVHRVISVTRTGRAKIGDVCAGPKTPPSTPGEGRGSVGDGESGLDACWEYPEARIWHLRNSAYARVRQTYRRDLLFWSAKRT